MFGFIKRWFERREARKREAEDRQRERLLRSAQRYNTRSLQDPNPTRPWARTEYGNRVRQAEIEPPDSDGFIESMAIATATGDPFVGIALGGNVAGSFIGAARSPGDTPEPEEYRCTEDTGESAANDSQCRVVPDVTESSYETSSESSSSSRWSTSDSSSSSWSSSDSSSSSSSSSSYSSSDSGSSSWSSGSDSGGSW